MDLTFALRESKMEILGEIFICSQWILSNKLTSMDLFKVQMLSDANGGYVQWSLG